MLTTVLVTSNSKILKHVRKVPIDLFGTLAIFNLNVSAKCTYYLYLIVSPKPVITYMLPLVLCCVFSCL